MVEEEVVVEEEEDEEEEERGADSITDSYNFLARAREGNKAAKDEVGEASCCKLAVSRMTRKE